MFGFWIFTIVLVGGFVSVSDDIDDATKLGYFAVVGILTVVFTVFGVIGSK